MKTKKIDLQFKEENTSLIVSIRPLYGCIGRVGVTCSEIGGKKEMIKDSKINLSEIKQETIDIMLKNSSVLTITGLINPLPGKKEKGMKVEVVMHSTLVYSEELTEDPLIYFNIAKI